MAAKAVQEAQERARAAEIERQAQLAAKAVQAAQERARAFQLLDIAEEDIYDYSEDDLAPKAPAAKPAPPVERPVFVDPGSVPIADRPLFGLLAYHRLAHRQQPEYADRCASIVELLGPMGKAFDQWVQNCVAGTDKAGALGEAARDFLRRLVAWADPLRYDAWMRREGFESAKIDAEVRRIGGPLAKLRKNKTPDTGTPPPGRGRAD